MSHKRQQMESTYQRAVAQVLARGLEDPRLDGTLLTVTALELTPDLKRAQVSVSVLPETKEELAMHGLRAAAAHVRHEVSVLVDARQMPELVFRLDRAAKNQAAVFRALNEAREHDQGGRAQEGDAWAR